jgi:hypothetical protein
MWTARGTISPQWVLNQFSGEGWNLDADRPYYRGLLDDQIEVNKSLGQLVPTTAEGNVGDLRFLQDRYIDEYRLKGADFPTGWVDEQGNWTDKAPAQLGAFWDVLKTAYRDPVTGELRRRVNYDPSTALGLSIYDGSNNLGGTNEYLLTDYTRPQLQDLSHLMPPEGLLKTPAQRAMVANQGAVWQPWAQTPEYTWSPTGAATYTPRKLPSLLDSNTGDPNQDILNNQDNKYIGPLGGEWPSYHDWYMKSPLNDSIINNHRAALERIRIANKNKANQINTEANAV